MFKCKKCSKMGKKCEECKNKDKKRRIENEILRNYLSQLLNDDIRRQEIEEILREEGLGPI